MGFGPNIDLFLTVAPLIVAAIGLVYYGRQKMQKLGVTFVIVFYTKWFVGVMVTVSAIYLLMLSSEYLEEMGYPIVLSLGVGAFAWFVPMHYISKFFEALEEKYKKVSEEE